MILDGIFELFDLLKSHCFPKLRKGNMFMVTTGDYAGQCFVFLEKKESEYGFLTIPLMENQWVPKESFDFGIENGIMDFIERAPKDVRNICKIKFEENKEVHRTS